MWAILAKQGWQWLLVVLGLIACGGAYILQHDAFPSQGTSSGQVLVTVYVKNSAARLLLRSFAYPNDPSKDRLAFSVSGPQGSVDPWLLVIQCPTERGFSPKRQVPLYSENAQNAPAQKEVIVIKQPPVVQTNGFGFQPHSLIHRQMPGGQKKQWRVPLGCFAPPASARPKAGIADLAASESTISGQSCGGMRIRFGCFRPTPVKSAQGIATGQTINVTLPTLEGDPAAQLTKVATPMYAEENARGSIEDLVEVYQAPSVVCPTPTPTPTPASSATQSGNASDSASAAPSAPNSTCYKPMSPDTKPMVYHIPASVETTETLENTNLAGDRVDSMFPPGQIRSDDQIYWQGLSGLSPSLNATNLAAESRNSEYSFFAGVFYGLGLSLIFAFVQTVLSAAAKAQGTDP